MEEEHIFETFYSKVLDHNGTLRITVPNKLVTYLGLKKGDTIKAMIKNKRKKMILCEKCGYEDVDEINVELHHIMPKCVGGKRF